MFTRRSHTSRGREIHPTPKMLELLRMREELEEEIMRTELSISQKTEEIRRSRRSRDSQSKESSRSSISAESFSSREMNFVVLNSTGPDVRTVSDTGSQSSSTAQIHQGQVIDQKRGAAAHMAMEESHRCDQVRYRRSQITLSRNRAPTSETRTPYRNGQDLDMYELPQFKQNSAAQERRMEVRTPPREHPPREQVTFVGSAAPEVYPQAVQMWHKAEKAPSQEGPQQVQLQHPQTQFR